MASDIRDLLKSTLPLEGAVAEGWIRTSRRGKDLMFMEVSDGSSLDNLQVVVDGNLENFSELSGLSTGSAVRVEGTLVASPAKGQRVELQASRIEVAGVAEEDYPLQKKRHSFEYLRTIAHLRPRSNTFGAVFRVRHALQMAVHRFFDSRGFIQVHTPIITTSDCEGAGQMFRVTTLDPSKPPMKGEVVDFEKDFFGRGTSLTVSGQLEAEVFAMAFKKVYTFGPTFRAENSNTSRHAAEFWMVEPEVAFCDLAGDADLAEDFLRSIVTDVLERCPDEMAFFDRWIEKGILERLRRLAGSPFERMTYTEAVKLLEGAKRSFSFPPRWGDDLQTEHERYLADELLDGPVFIVDYPREIKPFYMRVNDDGATVAAMDLLVPSVGEIMGGSAREERTEVLVEQMRRSGIPREDYGWYVDLRRYGGVPHAGFGLGFERAMMYVTGMKNIRDVIPFARTPGSAAL